MTWQKFRKPGIGMAWMLSLGLALFVSGLSLDIAVEAGHRLGGSPDGRRLMAGGGVVAVFNAHLLMAVCSRLSARHRLLAFVVSIVSAGIVVCVHASAFLSVQAQAGALRTADVVSSHVSAVEHALAPRRVASQILAELADVKSEQARLWARQCLDDCSRINARHGFLKARIAALDAEADEVRRWHQGQDRLESRKNAVKDDPVIARLADLLGVTPDATGLVLGLLFAVMLEGTGCLCWSIVLQSRDSTATGSSPTEVTAPVPAVASVTVAADVVTAASLIVTSPVVSDVPNSTTSGENAGGSVMTVGGETGANQGKVMQLLERVRPEIEAGRVRPTVT